MIVGTFAGRTLGIVLGRMPHRTQLVDVLPWLFAAVRHNNIEPAEREKGRRSERQEMGPTLSGGRRVATSRRKS